MALKNVPVVKQTAIQRTVILFLRYLKHIIAMESGGNGDELILRFFINTLKETGEALPPDLTTEQQRLGEADSRLLTLMDKSEELDPAVKNEVKSSMILWFLEHYRIILDNVQSAKQSGDIKNSEIYQIITEEARDIIASDKK